MPTAPEIERVEWRSSSAGELWVEVHGRWPGRPQDETLVLLVGEGSQPIAFRVRRVRWGVEAEVSARAEGPASEASGGDQFRAGFAIPVHLRRDLGTRLALRVGQHEIALPVARAARLAVEATSPPNVVDPAVLAERRARRAELGEETLARQAARAEAQVQDLEAQLDQLEHQLQDALAERERLKRELSARERELRVVRQREYSEQQLRVEAEEQRVRGERQARLGVEASRRELSAAEGRIRELETELERGRRNVAESEHAAQGPLQDELRRRQAVHDHVRAELETMGQELARLQADAQLEEQRRAHAEALAAELERTVSVLRDQLEVRERALTEAEQMVAALRGQTAELMRTLEGERRDHLDAERELRTQLEAQAAAVQSTTAELRDELARATQESHERERREAELLELLAEFVETATTLRETFEREMAQVREELEARLAAERDGYTQQLSEFEDRVWRLRGQLEDAAALSEELELRSRTEAQAREALADAHAELRRLQHSETRARTELAQLRAELAAGTSTAERTSTGAGAPPREPAPGELELEGAASVPARSEPPPAEAIPDETTVSDRTVEEAPRRGTGEAPRRGTGEAPRRGTGEAPRRGTGEERRVRAADLTDAFRRLRERAAEGTREFPPPDAPSWMPQAPR
ncbi:MAG TPA: hypothetical protein VGY97_06325, partial [Solirubrobacteraceae bacterium]|nr:hypothetical protein [Solirubrobacteraceae bacterium]